LRAEAVMWKDHACWAIGALALSACCSNGKFPSDIKSDTSTSRVDRDEHVERWRVNGEEVCGKVIETAAGCYVLEVKYSAHYLRVHGTSPLWAIGVGLMSPALVVGAAVDTEKRTHRAHYASVFVPFALATNKQFAYYVTSTFTGDGFIPRIAELNGAGEKVREIKPAKTVQELDACNAGWSKRER
jgi:hypothetical protein